MYDLFLFVPNTGIVNFADDNTPHAINKNFETILKDLEQGSDILLKWFRDNRLKATQKDITSFLTQMKKDI